AMGIRQSAQPLGVAVAALALPSLAARGLAAAFVFLGGFCLLAAALVVAVVRDPARGGERARAQRGSPYRTGVLWRIHAASALLVVPQFTVSTFALVFLVEARGWAAPAWAGRALGIQNTGQNAVAALTPPLVAVLIGAAGYPAAFAVAGVLPLAAAALVPLAADRRAPPRAEAAPAAQAR